MSPANMRRRITGLERRGNRAWALYVTAWLCLTGAAAFLVLSFMCWAGVVAMVAR